MKRKKIFACRRYFVDIVEDTLLLSNLSFVIFFYYYCLSVIKYFFEFLQFKFVINIVLVKIQKKKNEQTIVQCGLGNRVCWYYCRIKSIYPAYIISFSIVFLFLFISNDKVIIKKSTVIFGQVSQCYCRIKAIYHVYITPISFVPLYLLIFNYKVIS